jgi:hypothetical protein
MFWPSKGHHQKYLQEFSLSSKLYFNMHPYYYNLFYFWSRILRYCWIHTVKSNSVCIPNGTVYTTINGAVYTTIISTNVNKNKSILMYHHPFIVQRISATCFDLQKVIIRSTYNNSVLVLNYVLIWIHIITICFIFDSEYYLIVEYI